MNLDWDSLEQMDFEQAYTFCDSMQKKSPNNFDDQLLKVQLLNQQYCPNVDHFKKSRTWTSSNFSESREGMRADLRDMDAFDQFFSHTESDALEKFLDSLASHKDCSANDVTSNLDTAEMSTTTHMYNFQPMKFIPTPPQKSISPTGSPVSLKRTLSEKDSEYNHNSEELHDLGQLPTPGESRLSSTSSPSDALTLNADQQDNTYDTQPAKRRRIPSKPLLTADQKRFNHSHSEQKRRQLCKQAYERCLRLVINIEEFTKNPPIPKGKRSKRKQFNKDGLPNLSKHASLMKITKEIMKLQDKNEGLRRLLEAN